MADRITFRPRGRGCCETANDFVSITEPRVKFKRGWLTGGTDPADGSVECGDGTDYPLLVTVDQLCEIAYRTRDVELLSGGFSGSFTRTLGVLDTSGSFDVSFQGGTRDAELVSESADIPYTNVFGSSLNGTLMLYRGNQVYPPVDLLGTFYDTDYEGEFGEEYTVASGDFTARDALSERSLWRVISSFSNRHLPCGIGFNSDNSCNRSTTNIGSTSHGFMMSADVTAVRNDGGGPTGEYSYTYFSGTDCIIDCEGHACFIDTTGSGNPYDPGNSIYMKLEAQLSSAFMQDSGSNVFPSVSTKETGASSSRILVGATGTDFIIKLSNGVDLSCPLYWDVFTFSSTHPALTIDSVSDLVFEVDKWWEYKDKAGLPAWGSATGLATNGGPAG